MRLTTKSRYGTRAIFDIAYHSAGRPVQIKDISRRQEIPQRYLEQIFQKLKKADIVKSVRGPGGGYMLARDSGKIAVGDVIRAVRETIEPVFCVDSDSKSNKKCSRSDQCVTRLVWKEAGELITEYFNSVSIGDLCKKAKSMGLKKEVKHPYDYNI
jgi:Rrf2 family protein